MKIYSPVLLDTNVLVYYHQDLSPFHAKARAILEMGFGGRLRCVSARPECAMGIFATASDPRVTAPVIPDQALSEVED